MLLDRTAEFDETGLYRYTLSRVWHPSQPTALFVMLNPSTADENRDDHTIKKCMGLAARWGYGAIMVGNLFAYRSTDPRNLGRAVAEGTDIIGPQNDGWIRWMGERADVVVAAWGAHKSVKPARAQTVMDMFEGRLHALAITKNGHPQHPLLIPYATQAVRFPCEPLGSAEVEGSG